MKLSIVIPTLGGETLYETLGCILSSNYQCNEILICMPSIVDCDNFLGISDKIKIIKTKKMGQVHQRAIGFNEAIGDLVLQLDDDIQFDKEMIGALVATIKKIGHGSAVAPIFRDALTNGCVYKYRTGIKGFFDSLYNTLICYAPWGIKRMGTVSPIGVAYGVNPDFLSGLGPSKVEWLPGGCVLCYKNELICQDFYPFSGKAYHEDVIHSHLRKVKNIQHYIVPVTSCYTEMLDNCTNGLLNKSSLDAKEYYATKIKKEKWKFILYRLSIIFRDLIAR